jgi:hypothetical protein
MSFLKRLQPVQYRLLLGSLIALAVISPLSGHSSLAKLVHLALMQIALIAAIVAAQQYRRLFWLAVSLGIVAFADISLEYVDTDEQIHSSALILFGLFFSILGATFLYDIFQATSINTDHICGAICVYFMLGHIWVFLYGIVLNFNPAALSFPEGELVHGQETGALTYFSFVTLTTLGYGDIRPLTSFARTACWLEAVIGQLYLTVLIARLVGLHLVSLQESSDRETSSLRE